jgi:DNA-binding response OmpR family regulator
LPPSASSRAHGSSGHILVVDDDPLVRKAICATMETEGYQMTQAQDGRAAIEAVMTQHFDLILLDLAMPELDGLEVLRQLRARRGDLTMPPVLVLTAHGTMNAAVESARFGAVDFLHKPVHGDSLRISVRQAMADHPQRSQE